MIDQNSFEGQYCYAAGDDETKQWFHKQWKAWPEHVDKRLTTNISFHWGGVKAYRIDQGKEPEMSVAFAENVAWLDEHEKGVAMHEMNVRSDGRPDTRHIVHKRAWIKTGKVHAAVAYCQASETGRRSTTTDDKAKVNCARCQSIMQGRG